MLRVFFAVSLAALLAGCASAPKPSVAPQKVAIVKAVKAAPAEQPTPNATVKKRWFDKFKMKWFH